MSLSNLSESPAVLPVAAAVAAVVVEIAVFKLLIPSVSLGNLANLFSALVSLGTNSSADVPMAAIVDSISLRVALALSSTCNSYLIVLTFVAIVSPSY